MVDDFRTIGDLAVEAVVRAVLAKLETAAGAPVIETSYRIEEPPEGGQLPGTRGAHPREVVSRDVVAGDEQGGQPAPGLHGQLVAPRIELDMRSDGRSTPRPQRLYQPIVERLSEGMARHRTVPALWLRQAGLGDG